MKNEVKYLANKWIIFLINFISLLFILVIGVPSIIPPSPTLHKAIEDKILLDPSEFFQGSKPRPKLNIVSPKNGEILETNEIHVHMTINGYDFPSKLRDSRVCLGLATRGERVIEECFDQSYDAMQFHASNLIPGSNYMLRVVLFERSQSLAVCVRSFRVGAIAIASSNNAYITSLPSSSYSLLHSSSSSHTKNEKSEKTLLLESVVPSTLNNNENEKGSDDNHSPIIRKESHEKMAETAHQNLVTIQKALQLALARHSEGKPEDAEKIYREILDQFPDHAEVLHLLGLVHYQKGDPLGAIGFIEKALFCASNAHVMEDTMKIEATSSLQQKNKKAIKNDRKNTEGKEEEGKVKSNSNVKSSSHETSSDKDQSLQDRSRHRDGDDGGQLLETSKSDFLTPQQDDEDENSHFIEQQSPPQPPQQRVINVYTAGVISESSSIAPQRVSSSQRDHVKMIHGIEADDSSTRKPLGDRSNYLNSLGECLRAAGRTKEALDNFNSALQLNPQLATAKFNLALTFQQIGELEKAMSLFGEVVTMSLKSAVYDEVDDDDDENEDLLSIGHENNLEDDGVRNQRELYVQDYLSRKGQSPTDTMSKKKYEGKGEEDNNKEDESIGKTSDGIRSPFLSSSSSLPKKPLNKHYILDSELDSEENNEESYVDDENENVREKETIHLTTATNEIPPLRKSRRYKRRFLVPEKMVIEAKIRECDLTVGSGDLESAKNCWEQGLLNFPANPDMLNELGTVLVQLGDLTKAVDAYEEAVGLGKELSGLNLAIVLELEGSTTRSIARYQQSIDDAMLNKLPHRHIQILMATALPRILPTLAELAEIRDSFSSGLDQLLNSGLAFTGDTAEPLHQGFSTGYHLGFHGLNNRALKSKLSRVYLQYCPPLATGVFMSTEQIIMGSALSMSHTQQAFFEQEDYLLPSSTSSSKSDDEVLLHEGREELSSSKGFVDRVQEMKEKIKTKFQKERPIRVGFLSRFFFKHPVGYLSQGIIAKLPRPKFKVLVFKIEGGPEDSVDEVSQHIENHADDVFVLPSTLNSAAEIIRQQKLHILIFPEVSKPSLSLSLSIPVRLLCSIEKPLYPLFVSFFFFFNLLLFFCENP
mmetsp:Transcript_16035/g.18957  ORF Transcript_16035/g.18957 Transcript_16035/m.18957 type:complete len:1102 (+) Transcript_16035:89-3394(+)